MLQGVRVLDLTDEPGFLAENLPGEEARLVCQIQHAHTL